MADGPRYLRVPYAEKDAAKRLGALWDPGRRLWYVPSRGVPLEREQELLSTWGSNPTGATSRRAAAAISARSLISPSRSLPGANNKHCASRAIDMYDRSFDGLADGGGTASTHEMEERCRDVSEVTHMLQEGCRVGASGYLVGDGFVVSDDEDVSSGGVENHGSDEDSASCGEASAAESGSEYVPTDEDDDEDASSVAGDGVNDGDDDRVI